MSESRSPIQIGVIGLGMMGQTHLDAYASMPGVKTVAVSDLDPDRLSGKAKAGGNIEGQAQGGFDLASPDVAKHRDGMDLIGDPNVQVVDVCAPTPIHRKLGLAALESGKHTLVEKPLGRTSADAEALADAAEKAWADHGAVSMCAMCMRFWPGWDWIKNAVVEQTYGKVRAATFRRVTSHPGGAFYNDGEACGGAALDLHIHDADFVRYAFAPDIDVASIGVRAEGYSAITGEIDHITTTYALPAGTPGVADDAMIYAEGGWALAAGFGFSMRCTVNFEKATADFDVARGAKPLLLHQAGETTEVDVAPGMGYDHELAYFVDCVRKGAQAERVTLRDAARSVKLVEAEVAAIGG